LEKIDFRSSQFALASKEFLPNPNEDKLENKSKRKEAKTKYDTGIKIKNTPVGFPFVIFIISTQIVPSKIASVPDLEPVLSRTTKVRNSIK
jgi:hypothetical protein